ncbi:MAG: hypothetical protein IJT87_10810 [Ruminiclostridium sp.]|nr:hypothetical protein [Ruminiclostridium sp.]
MEYRVNNLIYAAGKDLLNTIRTVFVMTEPVDAEALRKAADLTVKRYPYFSVKLIRRGEEYVMVHNDAPLTITPDCRAIPLGGAESGGHLLALSYDKYRISVDSSHFMTDGTGIFPFDKTLLYCYLHILHPEEEFDLSGIAMPDSEIPPDEADDYPFPDEPVETTPLGMRYSPVEVFKLSDQPKGYKSRDKWTSFRIKVKQKDLMRYASSVDGSPATFIASVMYRTIADLHPECELPIVCGMQHQYRKALGKPLSHLCHVNIVPIPYTSRMKDREIELLNTMARGTIIVRADDDNDLLSVNAHIENEKKIKALTLAEKHRYMRDFLLAGIGRNTFEVSYTGRVPFSGLDKYMSDFIPILDMSLSGGISIEIFTAGENFCINIMQRNDDGKYADRFVGILSENGIACVSEPPEHFEINDFVLPE